MPAATTKKPEDREFVVHSGASVHMVSKRDLRSASKRRGATENVRELDLFVTVMLLEETPAVLSLGKLCEDHGKTYHWICGQKPHLIRNGKRIDCNISNYVPFVVPGLSASSSSMTHSPASSTFSSRDSVFDVRRYAENPVPERSGSTSEELRTTPMHRPTETENRHKMKDAKKYTAIYCMTCRTGCRSAEKFWSMKVVLLEPRGNLAPEVQDTSSSSHELPMQPRAEVEPNSGKHSVYTHFPKNRNCDICLRSKITRASCRRRTGTVVPKAVNLGDSITADHNVPSEGCESRQNHRYAVVVQDLATQWFQSNQCKTKTSQENQKSLHKFLEPTRKPTVIYRANSLEFGKSCEELSWNHCTSTPHRSETNGTSAQSGLDKDWWADSLECCCYLRNIQDLLSDGKTPYERRFGRTIYRTSYTVWCNGRILPYFCERPVETTSIWS